MSLRLLLRDGPYRSLALVTDTHAFVFRHSQPGGGADSVSSSKARRKNSAPKCIVEFTPLYKLDLADYHVLGANNVHGTLGLISIESDVFLCVISGADRVATVRPGETVQRIHSVEFCQCIL